MVDTQFIGYEWPEFSVDVERGQVISFAESLGVKDRIYLDGETAKAKGFRDIPVLPTYLIALAQTQLGQMYKMFSMLKIDPAGILHGTQKFVFHEPVCVGDKLTGHKRITNLYDRKNGVLSFIETVIFYKNSSGQPLCEDHCTLVSRN